MDTPQTPFPRNISDGQLPVPPAPRVVNPDDPPWGVAGAVGVCVMAFLLMAVVQTALLLFYAVHRGVPFTPDALAEFATKDMSAIFIQVVSIIPAHLLTLGLAWLVVTRLVKYPFFRTLGWEPDVNFTFWKCAGLAVVLLLASFGIVKLTGNPETALDRLIESSRATALATAFLATFTAPLIEEIVFRGILYSALRRLLGTFAAVAVVMLVFAAIHVPQYWPNFGVIASILMLSLALTALRAYTGKLLPCFIVHLVFNGIQSFFIVINPYVERLSPEKSPAPGALLHALFNIVRALL